MSKANKTPFTIAGGALSATGISFLAVGLAGQPAFLYTGLGLLIPGVVLVAAGSWSKRRQA